MVTIFINSVERTSWIDWRSVTWDIGMTKEPDILQFAMKENSTRTIPNLGDEVVFKIDGVTQFSGLIVERKQKTGGMVKTYTFKCKDGQFDLDKLLVAKHYENMTVTDIVLDIVATFTDGTFTTTNVAADTPELTSIKFNYETVSKTFQRLADLIGYDWYVDADKDIHFFLAEDVAAPFNIDDTSGNLNFRTLNFNRNILELKNSIIVVGGDFKTTYTDDETPDVYKANGTDRTYKLIYQYDNIQVTVDDVAQDVGIDNITNEDDVDVLYNFQEKAVKFRENNKPTDGQVIKIFGDAFVPLIAQVTDSISVDTYGERQTLVKDNRITSIPEARSVAKAAIAQWATGSYEGSFTTQEGGLRAGQMITINSTHFGVNKQFKINKVSAKMIDPQLLEYSVTFIASGKVTFTDLMVGLLGRSNAFDLTDSDVLRRLALMRETLGLADSLSVSSTSAPYYWGTGSANDLRWGMGTWS